MNLHSFKGRHSSVGLAHLGKAAGQAQRPLRIQCHVSSKFQGLA